MAKNWYLKTIAQERTATGEKFQLITDVPCHLWMRYSFIPPKTHRISVKRRGIIIRTDLYFCFDVYIDNEQAEPGDTIIHTFIKEPWPYCQERWYYYHGEIGGVPSKSTTAIFYKHPKAPLIPPPLEYCYTNPWDNATCVSIHNRWESAYAFKPAVSYKLTESRLWLINIYFPTQHDPDTIYSRLFLLGPDNEPVVPHIAESSTPFNHTHVYPCSLHKFTWPNIPLTVPNRYYQSIATDHQDAPTNTYTCQVHRGAWGICSPTTPPPGSPLHYYRRWLPPWGEWELLPAGILHYEHWGQLI